MTAVSWETELHSLFTSELRDVMREVRNAMVLDEELSLSPRLLSFIDRVHEKFDRKVNYRYIHTVCFDAFFENDYQNYSENIGIAFFGECVLPLEAVHTTKYVDTVVRFMTIHLQNILNPNTLLLH